MLRIVSKCSTEEDFVAVFRRFSDRDSLYVPTPSPKPVGTETRFLITLAGGEPMLAGAGEVVETNENRENPFGRPGMRLSFRRLDDKSKKIVERLASARDGAQVVPPGVPAAPPLPRHIRPKPRPGTVPPASAELAAESEAVRYAEVMREAQRAPGAADVLPANPFGELTSASLEAFVDCTLYEETGSIRIDNTPAAGAVSDGDLPVWWPRSDQTPAPQAKPTDIAAAQPAQGEVPEASSPVTPDDAIDALGDTPAPNEAAARAPVVAAIDPTATPTMVPLDPFAGSAAMPLGATTDLVNLPPRRPLWKIVAVTAAATSILSFVVGYWWFGQRKKARAQVAAAAKIQPTPPGAAEDTTPAPTAGTEVDDDTTASGAGTPAAAQPKSPPDAGLAANPGDDVNDDVNDDIGDDVGDDVDDDSGAAVAAAATGAATNGGNCKAQINSTPAGATVSLGGDRVGTTPLEASLPCGKITLEFARSRYTDLSREFELTEGAQLSVDLERPTFRITITSSPAGADVRVGASNAGKTPVTRTVTGFETTKITISKPGYNSYSTSHYTKRNGTVKATLTPIKTPAKKKPVRRRTK